MATITSVKKAVAGHNEPVTIVINQRNGDPYTGADGKPSTVDVLGSESDAVRRVQIAQGRRMLRSRKPTIEPEDIEANRIERAAAAVTGWSGWEDDDGKPAPATPDNFKAFLKADSDILRQVEEAIERHSVFSDRNSES